MQIAVLVVVLGVLWLTWRYIGIALGAHRRWQDKLRQAVLLQVRTVLNSIAQQRGVTVLVVDRAPGLHGHSEQAHFVRPPEMAQIQMLTRELGAGVVAISGDRGVGKTTLLRALADTQYREPGSDELRLMLAAPVDYDAREFLVHLYLSLCELVREVQRPRGLSLSPTTSRWKRLRDIFEFLLIMLACGAFLVLTNPDTMETVINVAMAILPIAVVISVIILLPSGGPKSLRDTGSEHNMPIGRLADRRLNQLRFQQTTGLEHAGGLRPAWFELSRKTSRQLADRPMTLPELVESYRTFAERVVTWWRGHKKQSSIVIGIDEVDRIADAAQAERFLNEVKAIFGVRHCTYLVSVSEEALASFEQRVVRVRTVLDSAFDEVLRIDVLDLHRALELLGRRVIGVPAPFLALCHCLSGGVARDLIRVARVMFDARQKTGKTNLNELAAEVVHREVQTLKRGFATRLVNLATRSAPQGLLDLVADADWPGHGPAKILDAVRTDLVSAEQETTDIAQARTRLTSALLFYATVLEIFTDCTTMVIGAVVSDPQTRMKGHSESLSACETIEDLARVRSALPMSPELVRQRLSRIRSRVGLSELVE